MNPGEIIIAIELALVLWALVALLRRKPEPPKPPEPSLEHPQVVEIVHRQPAHVRLKDGSWVRHGSPAHDAAIEEGSIE